MNTRTSLLIFTTHVQHSCFTKAASVPSNAQPASYKVAYRAAQCKKLHSIAEKLILSSAIDMISSNSQLTKGYSSVKQHYCEARGRCRGTA